LRVQDIGIGLFRVKGIGYVIRGLGLRVYRV